MYQGSASHNAVFSRSSLRVSWARKLGDRINGGFAVLGDTLYVASFDRHLYALDIDTGEVRWRSSARNVLMSTPVIDSGVVVVGSGHNGFLYPDDWRSQIWGDPHGDDVLAFDTRSGQKVWSYHTVGQDMPSGAIANGRVIIANGDLHLYAIRLTDGKLVWRSSLPGVDAMASVSVDNNIAIVGTCRINPHACATLAFDVRNGRELWRNEHGGSDASAEIADGMVFVDGFRAGSMRFRPGGRDVVAAIDEDSGRTIWEYDAGEGPFTLVASGEHHISGTYVDGVLYQSISNHDEIVAFDGRSGKILWRLRTYAPVKMSPIITSNRIYFGDTSGLLYSADRQTGEIIHTSALERPFSPAPLIIVGETLFLANASTVVAIPIDEL